MNYGKMKELYVMMFALESLHNRGITVRETIMESLQNLLEWYRQSGKEKYMELALLHMQAYANMGFGLDEEEPVVQEILSITGKTRNDFFPRGYVFGKKIKITKPQIRSMIGRWRPSGENPMTIDEVVDDIMRKLKQHKPGKYIYQYDRKISFGETEPEVYELVISDEESYFYDVKKFRFYTFEEAESE